MIIFITDKQIRKNLRKFEFKTMDESVSSLLNKTLYTFVHKKLQSAAKKAKSNEKGVRVIKGVHIQSGGRVLMPSEYFGVPSNHYVENPVNNGVDMSVRDAWIRPPMELMSPMDGAGAKTFEVPLSSVKSACMEVLGAKFNDVALAGETYKTIQALYAKSMTDVFKTLRRKVDGGHLSKSDVSSVLTLKKYSHLV